MVESRKLVCERGVLMTAPATMLQLIATGDRKLMRKINQWPAPRWVRLAALAASRAGDGWLWYFVGVCVLLFGHENRVIATAAAGLAVLAGVGLFMGLKKVSGRKRPCEIEPHCWARVLPPDEFSFPSGHTITAFAVSISIAAFYPATLSVLLACAVCVAVSRILLGMHFLSDVVAGALIGTGLALASHAIFA